MDRSETNMNSAAELKLEIFRKIDTLNDIETPEAYNRLLSLIVSEEANALSPAEKQAIEIGLTQVKEGKVKYHSDVMRSIGNKLDEK